VTGTPWLGIAFVTANSQPGPARAVGGTCQFVDVAVKSSMRPMVPQPPAAGIQTAMGYDVAELAGAPPIASETPVNPLPETLVDCPAVTVVATVDSTGRHASSPMAG